MHQFKDKPESFTLIIILLSIFSPLMFIYPNDLFNHNHFQEMRASLPMLGDIREDSPPESLEKLPSLAIQPFQFPNISILFIVGNETLPDPILDQPFYNNITNLGISVTYHVANNSYNYSEYDAVIISDSISGSGDVASLENASIPILTMEPETWNVFNLGNSGGVSTIDDKLMELVDNSSYITNHLPLGPLNISTDPAADKGYMTGFNTVTLGSNVTGLLIPTYMNPPEKFYRSLVVLDKGEKDWVLNPAVERRVFLGTSNGSSLNQEGWKLWNKTLKWILYDDYPGNASITVNVEDLNNNGILNATVTLINSSTTISQYTNYIGTTTFYNISWGLYNITVEFNSAPDVSLTSKKIFPTRTYHQTPQYTFNVQLSVYIDNTPPQFYNIYFDKDLSQGTFHADIIDANLLNSSITLNVTAKNLTSGLDIVKNNFTMVSQSGNTFYNDTALDTLTNALNISITYNIIAEDTAANVNKTQLITFSLSDPDPPIIHELNVTDYGDGTLEFYAIITDESGIQDHVLLLVNGTLNQMHLNGSGFWTYRTQSYFRDILNYTVFSVNDTIGNENGSKIPSFPMDPGYITVSDSTSPQIDWITPYATHDEGLVEWNVEIYETTIFQSGLNFNSVNITISVNSEQNYSNRMYDLGAGYFYFFDTFSYNDKVEFWINASDLVENSKIDYGIIEITDSMIPEVVYNAIDFGNGTVTFYVTVVDWPYNITTAFVYENSTGVWLKYDLNQIDNNLHTRTCSDFIYSNRDLFYYAEAIDEAGNNNTLSHFKQLSLTDIVPPEINFNIENSPIIDGQITIQALATDSWGSSQYVTNPFYVNITNQGLTTTYEMEQEIVYYVLTHNFQISDQITINIWTYDDAGNQGVISKLITIEDLAPPKIKNHEPIIYQNGTVLIWTEVVDYGSGLADDNTSITISYLKDSYRYNATMIWNGTRNFYTFSISGYIPTQTLTYTIIAIDKNNNPSTTIPAFVYIPDLTPPVFNVFSYSEKLINHTASELSFWAVVNDPFGNIAGVNLTLDYFDQFQWFNQTYEMNYNGSHYIHSIPLICDNYFNYYLKVFDQASNALKTPILENRTLNYFPTTAMSHGVEFSFTELNPGESRFWIRINNTFEDLPFKDHYIKLSVFDDTLGSEILNEELMKYNETHHIYDLSIDYQHYFSYSMQVIDDGVLGGYYETNVYANSSQMLDYWRPIIHSSGITEVNETTIIIWADISDWGSGITEVLLKYEFVPHRNGGGAGSQVHDVMEFNDSLYIIELAFSESGKLNWFIEAYDSIGSSVSSQKDYSFIIENDTLNLFDVLLQMVPIILSTAVIAIVALYGTVTYRKKRSVKYKKAKELQEKLSIISNVYTILVSTEVGVPILNVMNILYQKDESLNDALSGLSVGIDSFLQSFQSDFMQQLQQESLEFPAEIESQDNIRMSVIEQHQIQILIIASQKYRIFVFLRKKPSDFTKTAFYNAINDFERNIHIPHLGVVDEALFGPQAEAIIKKYFPITLLMPFVIDTRQLKRIDKELKEGMISPPISREGINAIKRLVITYTVSRVNGKSPQDEIKIFEENMKKGLLKDTKALLFNDARKIMTKLLEIPPEHIHEALWTGSSPDVKIIVPHRNRD